MTASEQRGEDGQENDGIFRRRAAVIGVVALGILAIASLVINAESLERGGAPRELYSDPEVRRLQFDNIMAAHAVNQFSTSGQGGFSGEGAFHFNGQRLQIGVARSLDTVDKENGARFIATAKKLARQNQAAAGYLNKVKTLEKSRAERFLKETTHRWANNRKRLQQQLDYSTFTSPVQNPDADGEGKMLLNQVHRASKYVKYIASSQENKDVARFKKLVGEADGNQSRLAASIVGMSTTGRSADELSLLKKDAVIAKCISSGRYMESRNGC